MQYIYYNPDTLAIIGMSTDEGSMEYPSITTEKSYHSTLNMKLVKEGEEIKLAFKKLTL